MKSSKKVERFDYSKFESKSVWDSPDLQKYEFWGIHPKKGRLHIDTKRYKKACNQIGITDFLPEGLFKPRNTVYFVPAKIKRYDYRVNMFRDLLNELKRDWNEEYKPVFSRIRTPKEVHDSVRLAEIAETSCADDLDEIDIDAMFASLKREKQYNKIIQSLYCQFISKVCVEIDRYLLTVITKSGFQEKDFKLEWFISFSNNLVKGKSDIKLKHVKNFDDFNLLHKMHNFLKHNSIISYEKMVRYYPNYVANKTNKTADIDYENGMFAGDWLIIDGNYIDNTLDKMLIFFEDYCEKFFFENLEESKWNYDEYFKNAFDEMRYPANYFGVPY